MLTGRDDRIKIVITARGAILMSCKENEFSFNRKISYDNVHWK